jgi:hypothetical protein
MTAILNRPATQDALFLWIMHRFAEEFEDHAILKGGMVLRLLDSPRHTMDIDYVFVPFTSKKQIVQQIERVLGEIEGAQVEIELHSRMLRADLRVDGASIQIEANVAEECQAIPMATGGLAQSVGLPSQVVRVMDPQHALSHKLAAWNERRLLRDLYDCYFLAARVGASPNSDILDRRLARVESRIPGLRKRRRMSRSQLRDELERAVGGLTDEQLSEELAGTLPREELAGLAVRIRTSITKLMELLI